MSVVIQNCSLQQEIELASLNSCTADCGDRGLPKHDGSIAMIKLEFHKLKNTCNRLFVWSKHFLLASICTVVAVGYFVLVIIYISDPNPEGRRAAIDFNFENCISQVSHALQLYQTLDALQTTSLWLG